jgi:hypothetical protein
MSAGWLNRLMLGQLALKLSREHLAASNVVHQSDALTPFTKELGLNCQKPARWTCLATLQRCDAYQPLRSRRIAAIYERSPTASHGRSNGHVPRQPTVARKAYQSNHRPERWRAGSSLRECRLKGPYVNWRYRPSRAVRLCTKADIQPSAMRESADRVFCRPLVDLHGDPSVPL